MRCKTKDVSEFLVRRAVKEFEGIPRSHMEVVVDLGCPLTTATGKLTASLVDHVALITTAEGLRAEHRDGLGSCEVAYFGRTEAEAFLRMAETTWPGVLLATASRDSRRSPRPSDSPTEL